MRYPASIAAIAAFSLSTASVAMAAKPETPPGQAKHEQPAVAVPVVEGQPAASVPPGQAKEDEPAASTPPAQEQPAAQVPPGQAKKEEPAASTTPGQAKSDAPATSTPPGRTKDDEPATTTSPGQTKNDEPVAKNELPPLSVAPWQDPVGADARSARAEVAPLAHPAHTELGETVAAVPTAGFVRVRLPGDAEWSQLRADSALPVGALVGARRGAVQIVSETAAGVEQFALVGGSRFVVRQGEGPKGMTDLVMVDGDFDVCRTGAAEPLATAAASKPRGRKVRQLWASGKGNFRTRGSNAVATVRGTRWIVTDHCGRTTVRVVRGVVDVTDLATGKTVAVRAGQKRVMHAPAAQR